MIPRIVIFCCSNAVAVPEEAVERVNGSRQATVQCARLPCSGRTDVLYLLRALEEGADMALVVACPDGTCRFMEGNRRARLRVGYANRLLAEAGLGNERIGWAQPRAEDPAGFGTIIEEAVTKARSLGPWNPA